MGKEKDSGHLILVVEKIEEIRDGLEKLLKVDGYRVIPARDEEEATLSAKHLPPDLLLISSNGSTEQVLGSANRIREQAELKEKVPVVIFCIEEVAEGEEIAVSHNIYLTRPDNFNQLRRLIRRLLDYLPV